MQNRMTILDRPLGRCTSRWRLQDAKAPFGEVVREALK
jgi:hypothetical protein